MTLHPVRKWSESDGFFIRQFKFAIHVAQHMPAWPARTVLWHPPTDWGQNFDTKPCRKRGRPAQRWDDHLTQFAVQHFGDEHWLLIAKRNSMQFLLKYE
jgi:hypothetical protein